MKLMDMFDTRASAAACVAAGHPVLVHSFDQWRAVARELLAHHVAPHMVQWISHKDDGELFAPALPPGGATVRISRKLIDMLQTAACYRMPNRWAFLYLVLWRWQRGDKDVLSAADVDGARLHAMVKAVQREEHDMHAGLRFRERRPDAGAPRFVAWFEPAHDVLPQVARQFAARMGRVTWMIATPEASVMWDGAGLHSTGPLLRGPEDIDDTGAALWLTYCRSIFNPARLNAELMHGQMAGRPGATIPIVPAQPQAAVSGPGALAACRRCALWKDATQAVPGTGPADARIMLVGEQPGAQEDLAGLPFVGPAGQLLERALEQAGMERRSVYLTNAVKHFKWEPRGRRRMHKTPAQREVDACSHWLTGEIAQVRPQVIVALGSTALKAVTGNPHAALKDVLGAPFQHHGHWVVVAYHPSYVLRVPGEDMKAQAFRVLVDALAEAKRLAG
jgi:probable DNA metabolism protein